MRTIRWIGTMNLGGPHSGPYTLSTIMATPAILGKSVAFLYRLPTRIQLAWLRVVSGAR